MFRTKNGTINEEYELEDIDEETLLERYMHDGVREDLNQKLMMSSRIMRSDDLLGEFEMLNKMSVNLGDYDMDALEYIHKTE